VEKVCDGYTICGLHVSSQYEAISSIGAGSVHVIERRTRYDRRLFGWYYYRYYNLKSRPRP
jgi:hypothetical protein